MEGEFKIFGKSSLHKEKLRDKLESARKEASLTHELEIEKNEKVEKYIDFAIDLMRDEFKSLGLDYGTPDKKRIKLFDRDIIEKRYPKENGNSYVPRFDVVKLMKEERITAAQFFKTVLHELIHQASYVNFKVSNEGIGTEGRVGFSVVKFGDDQHIMQRLVWLNEGFTDLITRKIILKSVPLIESRLGVTKDEFSEIKGVYFHELAIVYEIVKRVAEFENKHEGDFFDELEKEYFAGNLLFLRRVEKCFGKGTVNLLSKLNEDLLYDENVYYKLKEFLRANDESKKQLLVELNNMIDPL